MAIDLSEFDITVGENTGSRPPAEDDEMLAVDLQHYNKWIAEARKEIEDLRPMLQTQLRWLALHGADAGSDHDETRIRFEQRQKTHQDRRDTFDALMRRMMTLVENGQGCIDRMSEKGEKRAKPQIDTFWPLRRWFMELRAEIAQELGSPF